MKSRKAQAAVEYLMTHGWAILVLTAIIVLLYSIGMFNPSKYVKEECYFQPDLNCPSFRLAKTGTPPYTLAFSVSNGLGFDIIVDEIKVTATDLGKRSEYTYSGSCSSGICSPASGLLKAGRFLNVTFPIYESESLPERGTTEHLKISISYRNCGTDPNYNKTPETCTKGSPHTVSGRIVANIE
jgi:hypothetical protein